MKKIISALLTTVFILGSTTGVLAAPANNLQDLNSQEHKLSGYLQIEDEQTVVSEVLTFNELVQVIAEDENISTTEAANKVIGNQPKNMFGINSLMAASKTYRTISSQFTVNSTYKPSIKYYCETSESDFYWGIVQILNVGMNRNYNGKSKQFGGTVYTNLENAYTIYWIVNGDFFDNGTSSGSVGLELKVAESATVNFNLSGSDNHYAYCYEDGRIKISR